MCIEGIDSYLVVISLLYCAISIKFDGGIEYQATIDIAIRLYVRAASSQTEAERSFTADNHIVVMLYFYCLSFPYTIIRK